MEFYRNDKILEDIHFLETKLEREVIDNQVKGALNKVLQPYQNEIGKFSEPIANLATQKKGSVYNKMEGLVIRFDFITQLDLKINNCKICYGIFRNGDTFYTYREGHFHSTIVETYRTNKAMILERELIRDIVPFSDSYLYIEMWVQNPCLTHADK